MSTSKLISSDSHFYEPPDLWERWIEPKFRDRAPFVAHEDNTDQWYADGDWKFGDFNLTNAGLRFENPELLKFEGRYEDVLLGGLNPHAHVKEMNVDGISAGVLYPSPCPVHMGDSPMANCSRPVSRLNPNPPKDGLGDSP